ncbi:hypothetical protein D9611_005244 [Ephemerocybe angulata]|uniref:Uncharacterized protein n=1 Tax=Ephemerocybe angulata TaxID=980116 RepID=A0A8H5C087_9AGAR|nr:hypothetical protein D9611_005244 [Tulosesus angulatus]
MALPTEILTKILRLATVGAQANDDSALSSVLPSCLIPGNFPEESLRTKHALALVSRQWNSVATIILYEQITLPIAGIEKLLHTLTTPVSGGGPSDLARLVKRVDIPAVIRGERIHLVAQLCKKTTNLIAFFALLENGVDPRLLLNVLPGNLVHLHIQGQGGMRASDPSVPLGDLNDFLVGHPDLATLSIPSELTGGHTGLQAGISWPSVRKLTLQSSDQTSALARYVPTGALPNLEVVAFQGGETLESDCTIDSFLLAHGGSLVSVGLTQDDLTKASPPMRASLQQVDQRCPRVKEITVAFRACPFSSVSDLSAGLGLTWVGNVEVVRRMPRIVSLGIQLPFPRYSPDRMDYLQSTVAMPWTKMYPELQRITVMEEVDVEEYRAHDKVTHRNLRMAGRFAKHPIRVEDITGNSLGDFSKGMCVWV